MDRNTSKWWTESRRPEGRRAVRRALVFLALALSVLAAPAHAQSRKVTLLLKWDHQFQFAGYYAALWQGYYEEAGLDVELRSRLQPDGSVLDVIKEVDEGRADFAVGATDILLARDRGIPLVILASIFQRSAHTLVSLESIPLNKPSDLRGRSIGYAPDTPDAVETDALLRSAGLNDNDILKRPFLPGIAPLVAGNYEVGAEYPSAALWRAQELGVKINLLYPSDFETPFYGDTLFTHQRMVSADPELVHKFRDASLRGWQYAMDHPDQIAARIAKEMPRVLPMNDFAGYLRFEANLVRNWMRYPEVVVGSTNSWRWASIYRQLHQSGLVEGKADLGGLVFDEFTVPGYTRPAVWSFAAFVFGGVTAICLLILFLFSSLRHWALPLVAAALILGAIYIIDRTQQEARVQRARADLSVRLGTLRSQLEAEIRADVQLLKGLAAHVAMHTTFDESEFNALCARLTKGHTTLRSVVCAPDMVVKYVFPLQGNESVLGLDYRSDARQMGAALRVVERKDAVVAGPLELRQGGKGIVIRYPVFLSRTPGGAEDQFWGLVGISLDFESLVASTGLLGLSLDFEHAVRGSDGLGEMGDVFLGDAAAFGMDPVIQEVSLPSGTWQIAAAPRGGWNMLRRPDWTTWAIGLLVLSLVLLMLIFRERNLREQAESAKRLEATEATRARAQALARVSTIRHDFAAHCVVMSPEFCELLGLAANEMSVRDVDFLQYVDPAEQDRIIKLAALSQRTNSKYSFDTELLAVDGRKRRVHMQSDLATDRQGRPTGTFVTVQDITERYEAQEALRLSEERFALAILGSSDSLWDANLVTGTVFYSPRFREMFGLGPEWTGDTQQAATELIHPDDRSRIEAEVLNVLGDGREKLETELRAVTPDGRVLDILTRAHVARDERGNPVRLVGTNVDVTPLKNAERETRRLQGQLQQAQKMESIGHLAGGVAHDFNNILASILGFNELALNGLQAEASPARLERYLREVERAALRARDLVRQLLTFSQPGNAVVQSVIVADVVRDTLKMLRAAVPSSIAIEAEIRDRNACVLANAVQLHQVLLNLVINARDAVGDTGRVVVSVRHVRIRPRVCASCHQPFDGEFVAIRVSDNGCGIPAEMTGRIFEPFFTSKEHGKGTGMGLAVVHGTLHSIGAHLLLESEPGNGTEITLFLPPAPLAEPDTRVVPDAAREGAHRGARILIAEDEDAVAGFMVEALTQAGHYVERRSNGVEAFARFEEDPAAFDLLLTDQAMPLMSGSLLCERILNLRPGLPIILVSGYSESVNEVTAPAMGISTFLAKPVPLGTLVDTVSRVLAEAAESGLSA